MKNCLLTVISLSLWNVFLAQDYVIRRRRGNDRPDTFIVPTPLCSGDGSVQCAAMNGTKTRNTQCKCVCDKQENNVYYKSTFGVYDNTWKCASNTKVRNNGGCSLLFGDMDIDSPITTIEVLQKYYLDNLDSSCRITSGSYVLCSGNWDDFNQPFNKLPLQSFWGTFYISYFPGNAGPNLRGRIVRLNITCTSQQQQRADCVLFKMKGRLNCLYSFSSSSLIQPTTSISLPVAQLSTSTSSTPKLP